MTASTIPELVPRLLPRLNSEHAGEVVATARALQRTLHGAGLTFHDIAAALSASPQGAQVDFFEMNPVRQIEVLQQVAANPSSLSAWESKFGLRPSPPLDGA